MKIHPIQALRESCDPPLSRETFAATLGLSRARIYQIEHFEGDPLLETLRTMLTMYERQIKAAGLTTDDFVFNRLKRRQAA